MEVRRNEKITFRCTRYEKLALAEQAARCSMSTSEYCPSLSLGGRPRERYTEEERQLLRDIAQLKGTLQRLNNYFGGRQYREVFEENQALITELKKYFHDDRERKEHIAWYGCTGYDLAKEIDGQTAAIEIARHELYGCTGAEMVQEMKPYHADFPNVKNNCLRFEVSPSIEESATFTDADWAELGNDFMQRMGLANHQYIIIRHSGTEQKRTSPPAYTGKPGFPFRGTVPG